MKLDEMREMSSERTELDKVPDKFDGKVMDETTKPDSRGKNGLFVTIESPEGAITQKYLPMHLTILVECLAALGIDDTKQMVGQNFTWQIKKMRIGNSRWFPIGYAGKEPAVTNLSEL